MSKTIGVLSAAVLCIVLLGILADVFWFGGIPMMPSPTTSATASATEVDLNFEAKDWVLNSFGFSGNTTTVLPGTKITFRAEKGSVKGTTGCNSYQGLYRLKRNLISISSILATERACVDPQAMQQEEKFLQGLRAAEMYELQGDTFVITYDAGHSQLHFTLAKQ